MKVETTSDFERSAKKMHKSLRHLPEDVERLKNVLTVDGFSGCERKYDFRALEGMPKTEQYKAYKLHRVPSTDNRGQNGIRILACGEFCEGKCVELVLVDIRNDTDHSDQNVKNEIKGTMVRFLNSKISSRPSQTSQT